MEDYELDPDKIISWAVNYAGYEELESTAKAIYSVYTVRRKKERPDSHAAAKKARIDHRKRGWKK